MAKRQSISRKADGCPTKLSLLAAHDLGRYPCLSVLKHRQHGVPRTVELPPARPR